MITSDLAFANALVADFDAAIAVPQGIVVVYPNSPTKITPGEEHLVYDLVLGDEESIETGGSQNTVQKVGHLAIRIKVRAETGAARAIALKDLIQNRYRLAERAGALFTTPSSFPSFREDSWWVTSVICPFQADRFVVQ